MTLVGFTDIVVSVREFVCTFVGMLIVVVTVVTVDIVGIFSHSMAITELPIPHLPSLSFSIRPLSDLALGTEVQLLKLSATLQSISVSPYTRLSLICIFSPFSLTLSNPRL